MRNKKFITSRLLMWVLIISMWLVVKLPFTFAAPQLFEGDGSCTMGDIGIENPEIVQNKAKDRALRNAAEKAGAYIKSETVMQNHNLTLDQVTVRVEGFFKLAETPAITRELQGDATVYRCHVKVLIDPDEFMKNLNNIDTEKAEDQVKMRRDQVSYIEQSENEIANLRTQYKNAADDSKRQEIVTAIKHNENKFTAAQLYQRGVECYNKGDLNGAAKFYNQALGVSSDYAAPWTGLGQICNDQKQYARAIECFQKAISIYSEFAVPYNGLAYAYNYSKDFNKAIEYGNKAVQLDPNYAAAWNNIGLAYNNLGNFSQAVENYNKAIRISPNDDIPLANLATAYYRKEDFNKALEYYKKSTAINPNHPNVWYNLGHIYGRNGDIDKAIESYKKSTSLDPQNIRAWIMVGYLHIKQKNFDDAKNCFSKATKINPNDASAWAGLGFAYDGLGDYAKSYESFKKAVEIDPNNENYKINVKTAQEKTAQEKTGQ